MEKVVQNVFSHVVFFVVESEKCPKMIQSGA